MFVIEVIYGMEEYQMETIEFTNQTEALLHFKRLEKIEPLRIRLYKVIKSYKSIQ